MGSFFHRNVFSTTSPLRFSVRSGSFWWANPVLSVTSQLRFLKNIFFCPTIAMPNYRGPCFQQVASSLRVHPDCLTLWRHLASASRKTTTLADKSQVNSPRCTRAQARKQAEKTAGQRPPLRTVTPVKSSRNALPQHMPRYLGAGPSDTCTRSPGRIHLAKAFWTSGAVILTYRRAESTGSSRGSPIVER